MRIGKVFLLIVLSVTLSNMGCNIRDAHGIQHSKKVMAERKKPIEHKIDGVFTRSVETYELLSKDALYYLSDPKHLLMNHDSAVNQKGYYKNFEACVVGNISPKGSYGHLGKYHYQLTVNKLC